MRKLLTTSNPKTQKGRKRGYLTAVLHLAPAESSGVINVCPWSTPGCRMACLNTAGRGGIGLTTGPTNAIQEARRERTRLFHEDRQAFIEQLVVEIKRHRKAALSLGLKPAVRLNATSDIPWERIAPVLFRRFRGVQFYDYTKSAIRAIESGQGDWPTNYHLTYSRTEKDSWDRVFQLLRFGVSVAVVSRVPMPEGMRLLDEGGVESETVDGDKDDLRFLDPAGSLVYLKAKGRAKKDVTGFVV